jgi:protein required for attachment to host cells
VKPLRTWIVAADGAHAKFLDFAGRKSGARTVAGHIYAQQAKPTRDLGRDRPARVAESKGPARHAIEPRVDLHERQEEIFLQMVVRRLLEAFDADAFDNLVLIAPPKALGILRKLLPDRIKSKVTSEIDNDYAQHADNEIARLVIEHADARA